MEIEVFYVKDKGQVIFDTEQNLYFTYGNFGQNDFESYNEVLNYLVDFNINLSDIFFNFDFKK